MGYQMSFPEEVQLISGDSSLLSRPYKILMYADDTGCTSCYLKLQAWSNVYETELDKIVPDKLAIVILFDGARKEDILIHVQSAHWEMPVLWDRDGVINKQHKFPKRPGMRCMLLDNNNNVMLVGNPVSSRGVYELYLKFLLTINNQTNFQTIKS